MAVGEVLGSLPGEVRRLLGRLAGLEPGIGDAEDSRLSGLGSGMEEYEEFDRGVRTGTGVFRCGDGVVIESGLK